MILWLAMPFGGGEILTLRFSPGFERTEIMASLTNPFVFDSPYSAGVSLFDYLRWYQEYEQESMGSRVSVGREFQRDFLCGLARSSLILRSMCLVVGMHANSATGNLVRWKIPRKMYWMRRAAILKAALTLSANMIRADNIYMPTRGYDGESSIEFSGMDVDIAKYSIKSTRYTTVREVPKWGKHVVSYGGTFGILERPPKEVAFQSLKDFCGWLRVTQGF